MIRILALAALCLATPVAAQTITVAKPFQNKSGDAEGRVDFGTVNKRTYGVPYVILQGLTPAGWVYCGPKGCDAPVAAQAAPVASIQSPHVTSAPKEYGPSAQIAYGSASNVHATLAMDAFPLRQVNKPIVITDVIADKARDFVTPYKTTYTFKGVRIERVQAKVSKRGVYIRGDSSDWIVRDFRFVSSGPRTDSSIQAGIALTGTAHDILIERGYLEGFDTLMPGSKYRQGDCGSTERGNYNITIRFVECVGPKDGGFDLKSSNTRLEDLKVTNAGHYSYRLWAQGTAGTLVSINPGIAHVQAASITTDWVIDKLVAIGGKPLVAFDKPGGKITIKACDLSRWTGTEMAKGKGSVNFGSGCQLR